MQINIKLIAVIALLIINFSIYIHLNELKRVKIIEKLTTDLSGNIDISGNESSIKITQIVMYVSIILCVLIFIGIGIYLFTSNDSNSESSEYSESNYNRNNNRDYEREREKENKKIERQREKERDKEREKERRMELERENESYREKRREKEREREREGEEGGRENENDGNGYDTSTKKSKTDDEKNVDKLFLKYVNDKKNTNKIFFSLIGSIPVLYAMPNISQAFNNKYNEGYVSPVANAPGNSGSVSTPPPPPPAATTPPASQPPTKKEPEDYAMAIGGTKNGGTGYIGFKDFTKNPAVEYKINDCIIYYGKNYKIIDVGASPTTSTTLIKFGLTIRDEQNNQTTLDINGIDNKDGVKKIMESIMKVDCKPDPAATAPAPAAAPAPAPAPKPDPAATPAAKDPAATPAPQPDPAPVVTPKSYEEIVIDNKGKIRIYDTRVEYVENNKTTPLELNFGDCIMYNNKPAKLLRVQKDTGILKFIINQDKKDINLEINQIDDLLLFFQNINCPKENELITDKTEFTCNSIVNNDIKYNVGDCLNHNINNDVYQIIKIKYIGINKDIYVKNLKNSTEIFFSSMYLDGKTYTKMDNCPPPAVAASTVTVTPPPAVAAAEEEDDDKVEGIASSTNEPEEVNGDYLFIKIFNGENEIKSNSYANNIIEIVNKKNTFDKVELHIGENLRKNISNDIKTFKINNCIQKDGIIYKITNMNLKNTSISTDLYNIYLYIYGKEKGKEVEVTEKELFEIYILYHTPIKIEKPEINQDLINKLNFVNTDCLEPTTQPAVQSVVATTEPATTTVITEPVVQLSEKLPFIDPGETLTNITSDIITEVTELFRRNQK